MDDRETLKLVEVTNQNYKEFIESKKLMSRFDPNRKDKQIERLLMSDDQPKDLIKTNVLKMLKNDKIVEEIAKKNFKTLFDQNIIKLIE